MSKFITITVFLATACFISSANLLGQNAIVDISEEALSKMAAPHNLRVVRQQGVTPPLCPAEVPALFKTCEIVGFFKCAGSTIRMDSNLEQTEIPIALCRTSGGTMSLFPTGAPISWTWSIIAAKFVARDGVLTFHATIRTDVNGELNTINAETSASAIFDKRTKMLHVDLKPLTVALPAKGCIVTSFDLSSLYSFAVPVSIMAFEVPLPQGGTRVIQGKVTSISIQYLQQKVRLRANVRF